MTVRPLRSAVFLMAMLSATLCWSAVPVSASRASSRTTTQSGTGEGTLYSATNDPMHNEIVAYRRGADGSLAVKAKYDTGGKGTGAFENTDNMVIVGSSTGQSSPVDLGGGNDLLFVANAGSDDVSVFHIAPDGSLALVGRQATGQERPSSLTVRNGLLYVMNSAGDSFPGATFCFGGMPTITGFRVAPGGQLSPIANSTRPLPGGPGAGCTQIQFTPAGQTLVVSQFGFNVITTFQIGSDGTPGQAIVNQPTGSGPFGLNFDGQGRLLTTNESQARLEKGAAVSYTVGADGRLTPIGGVSANGETDTCWIVRTPDSKLAFTSSFGPEPFLSAPESTRHGAISSYRIGTDGALTTLAGRAATTDVGAVDLALTPSGQFLYVVNTVKGTVQGWRVGSDGALTPVADVGGLPPKPEAQAGGLAARDSTATGSSTGQPPAGGVPAGGGGTAAGTEDRGQIPPLPLVVTVAGVVLLAAGLLSRRMRRPVA